MVGRKKQQEQARAEVSKYEISVETNGDAQAVLAAADRAAQGAGTKWTGSIERSNSKAGERDSLVAGYVMKGPGGVMKIMTFLLIAQPAGNKYRVDLKIKDFLFQKGSMFSGPTINGNKVIGKFTELLRTELAAL